MLPPFLHALIVTLPTACFRALPFFIVAYFAFSSAWQIYKSETPIEEPAPVAQQALPTDGPIIPSAGPQPVSWGGTD